VKTGTHFINTQLRPGVTRRLAGFTLIEIMVAMVLLTVIVIGLMAMFNQTQRAFRAGMAQTDQLEGGRMFSDFFRQDLQQITPTGQTNGLNFFAEIPNYTPAQMTLPANANPRTNIFQDLFFMTRQNQYWSGIGYYVRTNASYFGNVSPVGTLYRFETNMHVVDFAGNGYLPFLTFQNATNTSSISKVLDGVVEFHVRCFDDKGLFITNGSPVSTNQFVNITNSLLIAPGEVEFYGFSNNVTPAFVELEVGVLEPAVLKRLKSLPTAALQSSFLASHAGNVQVFRQRIAIRNVDPSAYPQP
jgi:prepilin-type N-terminal cleavage/methylation domain-containing protein